MTEKIKINSEDGCQMLPERTRLALKMSDFSIKLKVNKSFSSHFNCTKLKLNTFLGLLSTMSCIYGVNAPGLSCNQTNSSGSCVFVIILITYEQQTKTLHTSQQWRENQVFYWKQTFYFLSFQP